MRHELLIEGEILIALDLQDGLEAHGASDLVMAAAEQTAILAACNETPKGRRTRLSRCLTTFFSSSLARP